MNLIRMIGGAVALTIAAGAAHAQKSADTVRIGMAGSFSNLSTYHESTPASQFLSYGLFDTLIAYDERTGTYQPLIATSWKRTDDRTLEFDIRTDAKWHDGTPVDVDDVVYTLDWLSDPATHLHLDYQWDWIDHVEKLSHTKFRLIEKKPTPYDLARLAQHIPILPEHKHGILLGERFYFGRSPVGSGPYRLAALEANHARVERVDDYKHGGAVKPAGKIKAIEVSGGWDYTERVRQWRNGDLDLLLDADPKLAQTLAAERNGQVTPVAGYGMFVLSFDLRGSGQVHDFAPSKALTVIVDRDALQRATPEARIPVTLCWSEQTGCGAAPEWNEDAVASARKALEQNASALKSLKITLAAQGAAAAQVAEIVAQSWRPYGPAVNVVQMSAEEFYMAVRDKTLDAAVVPWRAGSMPDVYDTVQRFFAPGFWDLHEDAALHGLADASNSAPDDTTRRAIVGQALSHSFERGYASAIAPMPDLAVHTNEVAVDPRGRWQDAGFTLLDLSWR